MALKLITAPATEPITLAEAKLHCGVDSDDLDDLITALIKAARQTAEHETGRPLITQTWELALDAFPDVEIALGKANVTSITSLTYTDSAGDDQVIASANYSLDNADTASCWLLPAEDYEWPTPLDTANALRVRFVCGYGAASDVPEGIKAWIKLRVGTLLKHREQTVVGVSLSNLPTDFVGSLLDPFRVYGA